MFGIPDTADDPATPVPELRLAVEVAALPEFPPNVSVLEEDIKTVGTIVLLSPEIAAPEPEVAAAEVVTLG